MVEDGRFLFLELHADDLRPQSIDQVPDIHGPCLYEVPKSYVLGLMVLWCISYVF